MPDSTDYRRSLMSGILRGATGEQKMEVNQKGELLVAQGLPPYTEMTRLGEGFSVIATAAVAGLVVRPGTVAAITLYNNELATGKSYVIDRIFTHCLVSGAEEGRFSLWACIHPSGMTAPTADIAASATNLTGNSGKRYAGRAIVDVGATVVDNGWYPWSNSRDYEPTGVLPGAAISVDVAGRLIVPPTGAISLQVVASMADSTYCSGISWYEVALDLQ